MGSHRRVLGPSHTGGIGSTMEWRAWGEQDQLTRQALTRVDVKAKIVEADVVVSHE